MPPQTQYPDKIEAELAMAREAMAEGNEGKVRVCARRAAGAAIAGYLAKFQIGEWGSDALSQLQHVKDDVLFPKEIRAAAEKLTTRITDRFQYPFSTDPVADALVIVEHFLQLMNASSP